MRFQTRPLASADCTSYLRWAFLIAAAFSHPLPAWSQFNEPEPTGLVSNTRFDWSPTISSDLLEAYFVSALSQPNWDIWSARRDRSSDPWTDLQPVEVVNTFGTEGSPHLSLDGLTLTFASNGLPDGIGGLDLWQATRASRQDPWQEPVNMGPTINTQGHEGAAAFSPDGLEIIYDRGCLAGNCFASSLRRSTRPSLTEPWGEPESMSRSRSEHEIGNALHPSLSQDGLAIYFSARGEFGQDDVFVSRRVALDAPFGPAENLGELINSRGQDRTPGIAADGSLYYVRNEINGQGPWEIVRAEPDVVASPPGEFDANGILDIRDLKLLTEAIRISSNDIQFDVDQSGVLDLIDRQFWVTDIKNTWIGDVNLDGAFDSGDMVAVFKIGKYESATEAGWSEGDWTGDQLFDSGDFVAAFNDGGYEQGPRTAINAVPEPSSAVLLSMGLIAISRLRRTPSSSR